jgi:hypothetical protein
MTPLSWQDLRPWNGSQNNAFEKLCCQLASHEAVPDGARFIAKAPPDAGIECYWIFPGEKEWGFQAKFFTSVLGTTQWAQLDESVKTALSKHPKLSRYTICLPIDRSDPRIKTQKSFKDAWDRHERKWLGWAKNTHRRVAFNYWGETEIFERLSRAEHRGRLQFWFDREILDVQWCQARLAAAIADVGPRYTPEINVDLPVAQLFDGLGRSPAFYDRLVQLRAEIVKRARRAAQPPVKPPEVRQALAASYQSLSEALDHVTQQLSGYASRSTRLIDFSTLMRATSECETLISTCTRELSDFETQQAQKQGLPGQVIAERTRYRSESMFAYEKSRLSQLHPALYEADEFFRGVTAKLANTPALLLRGDAGQGKTHLFCDVAKRRLGEGAPTILLLGQHFQNDDERAQIVRLLGLTFSWSDFLGLLNVAGETSGCRTLIMIDALNEGEGKRIWDKYLRGMLAELRSREWIAIALSVRASYEALVAPDDISENELVRATHYGFAEHEYEATTTFFDFYKVARPSIPLLVPEFQNPLFLKLFCEGLRNRGLRQLPTGVQGLTSTLNFFIDSVERKLARPDRLNYDINDQLVDRAVRRISSEMAGRKQAWLLRGDAKAVINAIQHQSTGYDESLFRALLDEGVISEDRMLVNTEAGWQEVIRFSYEKFADHLIAAEFLVDVTSSNVKERFAAGTALGDLFRDRLQLWRNKGLVEALAIQVPERAGYELGDVVSVEDEQVLIRAFLGSIPLRATSAFNERTLNYVNTVVIPNGFSFEFHKEIFLVATLPEHPYNAHFLHQNLIKREMPSRDVIWSIPIFQEFGQRGAIDRLLDWVLSPESKDHIDKRSLLLCGLAIAWLLTTSHRGLRDTATKALVRLFEPRPRLLIQILDLFKGVDDPYVSERLYAVAYGVAMRTSDRVQLRDLAQWVYDRVFKSRKPCPDVLLRDYARGVVEYAIHLQLEISGKKDLIRPPYRSKWPSKIPSKRRLDRLRERKGEDRDTHIARWSLYDSVMGFGDFARYIIGTNSPHFGWSPTRLNANKLTGSKAEWNVEERHFDLSIAQRWVFNRVYELGYDPRRFGYFDANLRYYDSGRQSDKPERIGKKYQWIAWHEFLARVSDNFVFVGDSWEQRPQHYEGPWQISYARDIDPSWVPRNTASDSDAPNWWSPAVYETWEQPSDERSWLQSWSDIPRIEPTIAVKNPSDGSEWLVLECNRRFEQPHPPDQERFEDPRRSLWLWLKSYLVRRKHLAETFRWAKRQDFMGRWMPESHELWRIFLGEFYWSAAFKFHRTPYYGYDGWTTGAVSGIHKIPHAVHVTNDEYLHERVYDLSIDEAVHAIVPANVIADSMGLSWRGHEGKYCNTDDIVVAMDPAIHEEGPHALVVHRKAFLDFLDKNDLAVLWTVLGEKMVVGGDSRAWIGRLELSGAYRLQRGKIEGGFRRKWVDF